MAALVEYHFLTSLFDLGYWLGHSFPLPHSTSTQTTLSLYKFISSTTIRPSQVAIHRTCASSRSVDREIGRVVRLVVQRKGCGSQLERCVMGESIDFRGLAACLIADSDLCRCGERPWHLLVRARRRAASTLLTRFSFD